MMIRRLLIALDGSPSSNAATAVCIAIAARHQAQIFALGIVDAEQIQKPRPIAAGAVSAKRALDLHLMPSAGERIEAVIEHFKLLAAERRLNCQAKIVEGDPSSWIDLEATSSDVVILGLRSLASVDGELSTLPLNVEQVVRKSVRPIILVPSTEVSRGLGEATKCVLLAFDGTPASSRTLHMFALLGLGQGRKVHVLCQDDSSTARAQRLAERGCELLAAHGLKELRAVGLGDHQAGRPAESILGHASSLDAGLVVMGAFGRSGVREIYGSCTRSVLNDLATPLFVYH